MISTDSLQAVQILELQQRIHDLEIQSRSFWDSVPLGLDIMAWILTGLIAGLAIMIGYNAWKVSQVPKEYEDLKGKVEGLNKSFNSYVETFQTLIGSIQASAKFQTGMTRMKIAENYMNTADVQNFIGNLIEAIKIMFDSNTNIEELIMLIDNISDTMNQNANYYAEKLNNQTLPETVIIVASQEIFKIVKKSDGKINESALRLEGSLSVYD